MPTITLVVASLILLTEQQFAFFEQFLQSVIHCEDNTFTSFPCWASYELSFFLVFLGIVLSSLAIIILRVLLHFIKRRRQTV